MAKVTYLLGAGASANAIPVVNNMNKRMEEVRDYLKRNYLYDNQAKLNSFPQSIRDNIDFILFFIEELNWLIKESGKHQTIDTLAKKYYLTSSNLLNRLKSALIIYFTIEQVLFINDIGNEKNYKGFIKKRELRYDSFFAALLDKNDKGELVVNPDVKILTWNYDQQIELALKTYVNINIEKIKQKYHIYPNNKSLENMDPDFDFNKFGVFKLNGNGIWFTPMIVNGNEPRYSVFNSVNSENNNSYLFELILEEYRLLMADKEPKNRNKELQYFNFSWESDKRFSDKYSGYYEHQEKALQIAQSTEYLVIIGYSFPVFNREMDLRLLKSMTSLKKIYIQDPNADEIKSTLETGFNVFEDYRQRKYITVSNMDVILPVQTRTSIDQFLIPFEL